jgi:hypothetical protein
VTVTSLGPHYQVIPEKRGPSCSSCAAELYNALVPGARHHFVSAATEVYAMPSLRSKASYALFVTVLVGGFAFAQEARSSEPRTVRAEGPWM